MKKPYYNFFLTKETLIDKEIIFYCFYEGEITKSKILIQKEGEPNQTIINAYDEYKNLLWIYTKGNIEGFLLKLKPYETRNSEFKKLKELNNLIRNYIEVYRKYNNSDVYNFKDLQKQLKDEIRKYIRHL